MKKCKIYFWYNYKEPFDEEFEKIYKKYKDDYIVLKIYDNMSYMYEYFKTTNHYKAYDNTDYSKNEIFDCLCFNDKEHCGEVLVYNGSNSYSKSSFVTHIILMYFLERLKLDFNSFDNIRLFCHLSGIMFSQIERELK